MTTNPNPTVIAMDDWLIYAVSDNGEIVFTVSEVWPEWLDFDAAPEDMEDEEFKRATLQILESKHPHWRNYRDWLIQSERDDAEQRGHTFDASQAAADVSYFIQEVRDLAERQSELIARFKGVKS